MAKPIERLTQLGQSVWYDNVSRGLLQSGAIEQLIDSGVKGLTSNPTIFEKAIVQSTDYDQDSSILVNSGLNSQEIYDSLTIKDIQQTADLLKTVYDSTNGLDGYASLEVSPHLAHDTDGTLQEARRLYEALDRPNVMIKVPATEAGIPAMTALISEGINVNNTLIFNLEKYRDVRAGYIEGLRLRNASGDDISKVSSVASFFVSRVDTAVDALLNKGSHSKLLGKAAIANASIAYRDFLEDFGTGNFDDLRGLGAQVQRPLWASTSTKNPMYPDLYYVEALVGDNTINTMPDKTLKDFISQGNPSNQLGNNSKEAREILNSLKSAGIDMDQVTDQLLVDGIQQFTDSFDVALQNIQDKYAVASY
tara:strand:- start:3580 stop:4674 length:1095 start_codon:yes stop_codon:yes gene_type:complete